MNLDHELQKIEAELAAMNKQRDNVGKVVNADLSAMDRHVEATRAMLRKSLLGE